MKRSFLLLLGLSIATIFYIFTLKLEQNRHQKVARSVRALYERALQNEVARSLLVAMTLSQNLALRQALKEIDEEEGHRLLANTIGYLQKYAAIEGIRAQIIARDLTIFARSWDKEFAGMPLAGFRKDLSSFKISHPKAGVETGRLLTIKATAPIKDGYKIIGYLEIISFFEPMAKRLKEEGMELFVLMDERFLDVATLMRENPMAGSYVVANRNYNAILLKRLGKLDLERLEREGHLYDGDYFYVAVPMRNTHGEGIGIYVLAMGAKKFRRLMELQENLSFFIQFDKGEFYDLINLWQRPEAVFNSVYDKSVLQFLAKVKDPQLRRSFEVEAREILRSYDKEALIDIILDKYRHQKKRGVIE